MSDDILCFVLVLTKDLTKADGQCASRFHLAEVLGNFPTARHASCASDKHKTTTWDVKQMFVTHATCLKKIDLGTIA